ncbi:hypothetical protein GCM10023085_21350 [Actinomadura viridis]|uniref:Uncharacterized protein n=1 Tax=Actinomadura viridis TaxID=58110 RepID=A0A931DJ70_9ACTN|nr:hypothetical protein [Actinomadura viridis]MBG6088511.1 hypothetical protein [Actinomadura viridis]
MSVRTPAPSHPDRRPERRPGRRPAGRHRTVLGAQTVPAATTRFSDDDLLLFLLVSTWELHTARPAPPVAPVEMTEEELIEYWCDPADVPADVPGGPRPGSRSEPGTGPAARAEPSA